MNDNETTYLVIKRDEHRDQVLITKTNNYFDALLIADNIREQFKDDFEFLDCLVIKEEESIFFSKITEENETFKIDFARWSLCGVKHNENSRLNKCEAKLILDVLDYQTNKIKNLINKDNQEKN